MGHKVNPITYRLGINQNWQSRWFSGSKKYSDFLVEDRLLRKELEKKLKNMGLSRIEIERNINRITIIIHVSKPGMVIGHGGEGIELLRKSVAKLLKIKKDDKVKKVELKIEGVKNPNLDAKLVAQNISDQLVKRIPFKRAMAQAVERTMQSGALGVKVMLAGRVGGAEIHRRVSQIAGSIPLSTIRAKIDYASVPSLTRSGYVGVKVWIYLP